MENTPSQIFKEYRDGINFKSSLGDNGMYLQNRINGRFYMGDHWHNLNTSSGKPLVRYNLIKRIGDYKTGRILSPEYVVKFSVPDVDKTGKNRNYGDEIRKKLISGEHLGKAVSNEEINFICSCLDSYFVFLKQKLNFDALAEDVLRESYITGTGILYTYYGKSDIPLKYNGEIKCEVLNAENVYFADNYNENIEEQPFIIISSKHELARVKKTAIANGVKREDAENIKADDGSDGFVTVLTKLFKEYSDSGEANVYSISVTENCVIREKRNTLLKHYPLSVMRWEKQKNFAYGISEITNLLPNQIAVNRLLTTSVWSSMTMGMPIMTVNGDVVSGEITNDPGQIIKIFGTPEDVKNAVNYVSPPDFSANFKQIITTLIDQTLEQASAHGAVYNGVGYNNTTALNISKEADEMVLVSLKNRFKDFLLSASQIFLETILCRYGYRKIKVEDEQGVSYIPFDTGRYKDINFCAGIKEEKENESERSV